MQNLHELTTLISPEEIEIIENRLRGAWQKETAYPKAQPEWSMGNRALGQCAVTALVINDLYGGSFAEDKNNNHIWNIFPDGSQQDFSREQMPDGTDISVTNNPSREDIIESQGALRARALERYQLLKKSFAKTKENLS